MIRAGLQQALMRRCSCTSLEECHGPRGGVAGCAASAAQVPSLVPSAISPDTKSFASLLRWAAGAQTHAQTSAANPGLWRSLRSLAAKGGARALFAGVGPRTARSAGAYAILMASYDLMSRNLKALH